LSLAVVVDAVWPFRRNWQKEGASVVLTGREPEIVANAVGVINKDGGSAHGVISGMVTQQEADHIVGEATKAFRTRDILVVR